MSHESNGDSHAAKKAKTDFCLKDYVNSEILDREEEFIQQYAKKSTPYPHAHLQNLLRTDFIESIRNEIKSQPKVNFKESDLFRVYQSIDLANMDDTKDADAFPTVLQLRRLLYSDAWRSFIERIAGLPEGTLSKQVDCACNCHAPGCHLLCHDDVIGTRKISYILYLTESDWKVEDGGALELYDSYVEGENASSPSKRVPDTIPCKTVLPTFNSMAFFKVDPGYSFHAVQEVLGDKPRLSLQGWYHAAEPPENIDAATLNRLKDSESEDTEGDFVRFEEPIKDSETFSEDDRIYLSQFLQDTYLDNESMMEIQARFEEDSSVQLRQFFKATWANKLQAAASAEDAKVLPVTDPNYYRQGVSDSWMLVGPSHKQRFLEYIATPDVPDTPETVGDIMKYLKVKVMDSAPFRRYLKSITSLGAPTARRGRIRRFRRGLDYTVAHYGLLMNRSVLDATVCFVAGTGEQVVHDDQQGEDGGGDDHETKYDDNDLEWQTGDSGGFECYIAADQSEEAADEYNQDDDTELLSVSASNNTLSLVYRDPGTMRFVKYLGSRAPSSRWDIAVEYEVPELDVLEEEEEEDDDDNGDDEIEAEEGDDEQ